MNFKLIILVFTLGIVQATVLFAQHSGSYSLSRNRLYRDVYILANDSLKGREAGKPEEKMAADYISRQMQLAGLLPKGGSDSSFLSEFRMNYPVIFREATLKVNDISFKYNEEFGATDLSSSGKVSAPFVNIGKGRAGVDYDLLSGENAVNGKIVIMDIDGPDMDDKNLMLSDIIARVKSAVQKGALGVILHTDSRKSTEDVLFGSPFTASLDVPVVYVARLPFNKIRKTISGTCTIAVEVDRTISNPVNVIGWINNHAAKTVVVGAHFDHVGVTRSRTGEDKSLQIHNGADDNASGTAAMLELARWATKETGQKYNYIFAAFSAEEKGLFGSKAFCSLPWVNNTNIAYMLNMDMVGRLGCEGDTMSVLGVGSSQVWEPLIDTVQHPDFAIKKITGAPAFSDHSPFLKKDIPVIYFTTGIHPDYHTPKDDTELINFEGMVELVSYLQHFIRSAEHLPQIPFKNISILQQTRAYFQTF